MANVVCNGCKTYAYLQNGIFAITGNGYLGFIDLTGDGFGAFGCSVDVRLGRVNIYYSSASDGTCRPLTGQIFVTGFSGASSGTSATGCTGGNPCTANMLFYYQPNINLYNQFSSSVYRFNMTNFCYGDFTGITVVGNPTSSNTLGNPTYYPGSGYLVRTVSGTTNACGTYCGYLLEGSWTVPYGLSGIVQGWSGMVIGCSPCQTGIEYELPF